MENLGCLVEEHPIDYEFLLIFPQRALFISLEGMGEKEALLSFVLFCAKNPPRFLGCL